MALLNLNFHWLLIVNFVLFLLSRFLVSPYITQDPLKSTDIGAGSVGIRDKFDPVSHPRILGHQRKSRISILHTKSLALHETDKEWIKTVLKHKKSLSFREKQMKIYDLYHELLPRLSYVIGSKQEFSSKIREFRNRLTQADIDYNQLDQNLRIISQISTIENFQYLEDRMAHAMMNNSILNNQCNIARIVYYMLNSNVLDKHYYCEFLKIVW